MPGIMYDGRIMFTNKKDVPVSQLWFIAKNQDKQNTIPLSYMWKCSKEYECSYDNAVMTSLTEYEKNIYDLQKKKGSEQNNVN